MKTVALTLISTEWPLPAGIRAAISTRTRGISKGVWSGLNLGDHVGDVPQDVATNRRWLLNHLPGVTAVQWLQQVHGTDVVMAAGGSVRLRADASISCQPGLACAVLTADCLPVLMASQDGLQVAAAHAGWRGLVSGILLKTLQQFVCPERVTVFLGPAIGPQAFEVGPEVRLAFVASGFPPHCFSRGSGDRFYADLYALARWQLLQAGVASVSGGNECTFSDAQRFYSYRRDGVCGRQASLIWRENGAA
jgi:polyphenol oxidase